VLQQNENRRIALAVPKTSLNTEEVVAMLHMVADAVIAAEPILTDADRALGDGDHGLGMQRGMNAAKEALDAETFESVDGPFTAFGKAMMSSMGGASGVVFGTVFRGGGRELKGVETFDSTALSSLLNAAAEGVMKKGGAKPGDKTMLDALVPAAEKAKEVSSQPLPDAIRAVADAAEAGKEASKDMIATMGRAKTLGERSLGKADAGAVSVTVILSTMRDYITT